VASFIKSAAGKLLSTRQGPELRSVDFLAEKNKINALDLANYFSAFSVHRQPDNSGDLSSGHPIAALGLSVM